MGTRLNTVVCQTCTNPASKEYSKAMGKPTCRPCGGGLEEEIDLNELLMVSDLGTICVIRRKFFPVRMEQLSMPRTYFHR